MKKLGLTTKIFIALIFGVIVGTVIEKFVPPSYFRDTIAVNGVFYVIGTGFIRLMKMLVVPLVFCSLVCGTMSIGDTKKLGRVGIRTLIFYLATTACAIGLSLVIANIANPGLGLDVSGLPVSEEEVHLSFSFTDTLINIIPENPIHAIANGDMLPIILFAVLIGLCIARLGEKSITVAKCLSEFNDIMTEMTMLIMKTAPIGVFCLVARTFSNLGIGAIFSLIKYIITVALALGIHCFGVYMLFLFVFTRLNPIKFLKKMLPVMQFAFSTATSNSTIPMNIQVLDEDLGVSKEISSFTIPLGATINMDGTSIMQGVAVVFAAQAFNIDLTVTDYITVILTATLASVGTAGVPSAGLITLSMVFSSVNLPSAAIGLIMGIDRLIDMMRTTVNITGDAVCTTIVAHRENRIDLEIFNK